MLICLDCERTFEDAELATWNESRGEFWGQPCYETLSGCPYCFSGDVQDYDEYLRDKEREAADMEEGEDE